MMRVEYRLGKTLLVSAFFGVFALLLLWIFISPDDFVNIRRARWLTSGFGRYAVLPVFLTVTGLLSLRAASFVFGDRVALEMTSAELRLNGYWGRKAVRWS